MHRVACLVMSCFDILCRSPELLQEKPYSMKNDVWGLGCVMYELSALRCVHWLMIRPCNFSISACKILACAIAHLSHITHL